MRTGDTAICADQGRFLDRVLSAVIVYEPGETFCLLHEQYIEASWVSDAYFGFKQGEWN